MEITEAYGFRGLYLDQPADMSPDGALVGSSKNFRIIDGEAYARYGYEKLQSTALQGTPLSIHVHETIAGVKTMIVGTTTRLYYWDDAANAFKLLNWFYNTGTVSTGGAGNRTVTGSGTTFAVAWDDNPPNWHTYIQFAADGSALTRTAAVDAGTWYEVATVDSTTQITLNEDGPVVSAKGYILMRFYRASQTQRWYGVNFYDSTVDENLMILTNNSDFPIEWDGDKVTDVEFQDLGGTPPKAKYIGTLAGHLVFGNIDTVRSGMTGTDTHYTIIWSPVADSDAWTGSTTDNAGYQELYETEGPIRFLAPFSDGLVVAKEDCVVYLQATGLVDAPFNPFYTVKNDGSLSPEYCKVSGGLLFLTNDDIVMFDGSPLLKSIAEDKVRRAVFNNIETGKWYNIVSTYSPRLDEWRICVPPAGGTLATRTWIYQIKNNEWAYDDEGYTAIGKYNDTTSITINDLTGQIDSYGYPIDEWTSPGAFEEVIMTDSSGNVYIERPSLKQLSGADIDAIIETKDIVGSQVDDYIRVLEVDVHYRGTSAVADEVSAQLSVDQGLNYKSPQTFNNNESTNRLRKRTTWNATGRTARMTYSGRHFKLIGQVFRWNRQGRR